MEKKSNLDKVVNLFSEHFITFLNYPPLAAKIYALLLVLYRDEGVSFKDLIELTNSSKSSVSTSLTFLSTAKKVTYSLEEGGRRKLFKAVSLASVLSSNFKMFNSEKMAVLALDKYMQAYDVENYQNFKKVFFEVYVRYIEKVEQIFNETEKEFDELYEKFGRTRRS